MNRTVKWFDDPRDADLEDAEFYAKMTCQERLDAMVELLNTWGKWNERRLERVAHFVELPQG